MTLGVAMIIIPLDSFLANKRAFTLPNSFFFCLDHQCLPSDPISFYLHDLHHDKAQQSKERQYPNSKDTDRLPIRSGCNKAQWRYPQHDKTSDKEHSDRSYQHRLKSRVRWMVWYPMRLAHQALQTRRADVRTTLCDHSREHWSRGRCWVVLYHQANEVNTIRYMYQDTMSCCLVNWTHTLNGKQIVGWKCVEL